MRVCVLIATVFLLALLPALAARGEDETAPGDMASLFAAMVRDGAPNRFAAQDALLSKLLFELPREAVFDAEDRPGLEDIRRALKHRDPTRRILGAAAAARLGIAALPLREELMAGLADPSPPLRYWICEALRKLGPEAALAAPALAELIHACADWGFPVKGTWAPGWDARDDANLVLAALVAMGPPALPALAEAFDDRDYTRPNAIEARALVHRQLGDPLPPPSRPTPDAPKPPPPLPAPAVLLERMEAEADAGVAQGDGPFETLFSRGAAAVPALVYGTEHGSATVRETCLEILAALGPAAAEAADFLFPLLTSDDEEIRRHAVVALGATGVGKAPWVPALLPFLDLSGTPAQQGAARTLGAIGPHAGVAREKLIALLLTPDEEAPFRGPFGGRGVGTYEGLLRARCAEALGRIGGPPEVLVPPLLASAARGGGWRLTFGHHGGWRGPSWNHPERQALRVRDVALGAIGRLGLPALPVVRSALTSPETDLRAMATLALAEFPSKAVGASAREMTRDPELAVREAAIPALMKAADEASLHEVARLVPDTDRAMEWLGDAASAAEAAAPALVEVLLHGPPDRQRAALDALEKVRPDSETCFAPAIAEALESNSSVERQLLWALRTLGDGATGVLDRIVAVAPHFEEDARINVLALLRDHEETLPARRAALRTLASDPSPKVRHAVALGIAHLGLDDAACVAAYAPLLDDPAIDTADMVARAFAAAAPRLPEALEAIAPRIADKRMRIRLSAMRALLDVGRGEDALATCLDLLAEGDKHLRARGVVGIRDIRGVEAALPRLMDLWETEKEHAVRFRLLPAIASTGKEGSDFVFAEYRRMRRDPRRHLIRQALVYGGEHAVPELRRWLRAGDLGTYYAGAAALGAIGAPARVAIGDLRRLAETGRPQALMAATEALFHLDAPDDVLLTLVELCLLGDDLSRTMACSLLPKLGTRVLVIEPVLAGVFAYERFIGLRAALEAVSELAASMSLSVRPIMAALPGHRTTDRALIVHALARFAPHETAVRPALLWSLRDPWAECRLVSAEALLQHFGDDGDTVAAVARLLRDDESRVRLGVGKALVALGERAAPALPELLRAAEGNDRALMQTAVRSLANLTSLADVVRPQLVRFARGDDAWRAREGLAALGRLGGDPAALEAVFREAEARWDWRVRLGAIEGRAASAER